MAWGMGRARIMVVDDEPDILEAMRNYLGSAMDAEIVTAASGPAALAEVAKGPPFDAIVSDYRMPAMNGVELLGRLRDLAPEVPRIMLTAFPDMQVAIDALNRGSILHFLTKPVQPEQLLALLQKAVADTRRTRQTRQAFARATGHAAKRPNAPDD